MGDVCLRATHTKARLEIAVALTTGLVQEAQRIHGLAATSAVALGRLLTGTALLALTHKREGTTSIQILSRGRIGNLYADCNHKGHVRGMTKRPHLAFPPAAEERRNGRRALHRAVFPGQISVIRRLPDGEYGQSSTPLVSGEIDEDIESFMINSDQIPSLVVTDVLLDEKSRVTSAAGVLVQAMPDGDPETLLRIRGRLVLGALARTLPDLGDASALLAHVSADAVEVEEPAPIAYRCHCSRERVLGSLRMFPVTDLAEMVDEGKTVDVNCDLCGKKYPVSPADLQRAFEDLVKAQG